MAAAYASAAAGQSQVLLITGEAGIGKTRLVEDLVQQVRSAGGAQVRIGESAPLAGAALAYGPFVAALGERAAWLLTDDEPGDMAAARHRLFERVLALLAELAAEAPLVLVLEDLHWADESSHELLAFLAVRLRELPVLVVVTIRDEDLDSEAQRWLADLQRRPRVTRLRVSRLAPGEVAELVAGLVPAAPGPTRWSRWSAPPRATRCTHWSSRARPPSGRHPRSPRPCWPRRPAWRRRRGRCGRPGPPGPGDRG